MPKFNRTLLLLFFIQGITSINAQNEINASNIDQVIADTTFVNLKDYSNDFVYDMKYATEDNFLKAKVYDCAECFLRLKTVKALVEANKSFMKKGYKIKLFDCYRPLFIQKRMWEIVSNPKYVADPKKGSIHNRGGAVDITLVDRNGKELDMGTSFDFFGKEASHNYMNLSDTIKANRQLLKKIMIKNNFNSFDSEWWHYNLKAGLNDKVSNTKWNCD
ncbi:M15 family metallopeptidase [Flavobacterium sp. LS1R47]|jgi:D-alanyl-D-alanine dipeptidase|uniref:D-alanyl-D-alanine dipeptidase n=1 Tax=Flavobacterium frigoritolerans TaxID=2987686 RepID=A0A9X3C1G3_9FLAO|nr:M15 family metallopeptidase [Flavobacterium frigoritolerans]MCV9933235.1 M15 family metallopeptidase [Flavobacterium frigoritolerans]